MVSMDRMRKLLADYRMVPYNLAHQRKENWLCVWKEKRKTAQQCVGVSVVSGVHCHCHQVLMRKFPDGEYKEGCSAVFRYWPKTFDP